MNTNVDSKSKDKHIPSDGDAVSKKKKNNKFEKAQCSYCMRGFHQESHCMKKIMDEMEKIIEQHNIAIPKGTRNIESGEETKDHDERCHALNASC